VLFDPRAHEPLTERPWDAAAARAAIGAIAAETDAALRPDSRWWPLHPLDDDGATPAALHGVYLGAAGTLWGLDRLARAGLHEPGHDYAALARTALEDYRERPEFGGPQPSLWMGEGGIALVAWLLDPDPDLADRLEALVALPPDDSLELMWGSPGLLAICDVLLERTGEERWATAWSALAEQLLERRSERVPGLWTQRLYGREQELLGPVHGLAGIAAMLARRPELLAPERLVPGIVAVLSASAVREDDRATWPPRFGGPLEDGGNPVRTQWCHGAPGMVAALAALPPAGELDELLLAGGELTWAAGPLRKGAGLCHGTAGNGLAFLALFARTGDERWLARARAFAMHAAAQVAADRARHGRGRHPLWTGDPGTAAYLAQCLEGGGGTPAFDRW
jgi:hypothetical protein